MKLAFHCWNGAVLPATRDFQATGSLASTCASRLVLHVRDMTPDNHAQGHLRCASTLVPSLRHKRTRHTAGEPYPKSSQRLCAEREEHLPHLRERCRAHATFYSPTPNENLHLRCILLVDSRSKARSCRSAAASLGGLMIVKFIGSGPGPVRDFGTERAQAQPLGPIYRRVP